MDLRSGSGLAPRRSGMGMLYVVYARCPRPPRASQARVDGFRDPKVCVHRHPRAIILARSTAAQSSQSRHFTHQAQFTTTVSRERAPNGRDPPAARAAPNGRCSLPDVYAAPAGWTEGTRWTMDGVVIIATGTSRTARGITLYSYGQSCRVRIRARWFGTRAISVRCYDML